MDIFLGAEAEAPGSIYWFELQKSIQPQFERLKLKNYGDELTSIGIISIILSDTYLEGHPERRYFSRKRKEADIRLHIPFHAFIRATPDVRRRMYDDHIMKSLLTLRNKVSKDFLFDELVADVENILKSG